jgi:hypothetical protein
VDELAIREGGLVVLVCFGGSFSFSSFSSSSSEPKGFGAGFLVGAVLADLAFAFGFESSLSFFPSSPSSSEAKGSFCVDCFVGLAFAFSLSSDCELPCSAKNASFSSY